MKLFYTESCKHLANLINIDHGRLTIKRFSDGELSVLLEEDVAGKEVWVLASTPPSADNLLELLLVLDVLQRNQAHIKLLIPYFGYARQDRPMQGYAFSAEMIFKLFYTYVLKKFVIIHIHNPKLRRFIDFQDYILLDFFEPMAQDVDCIVAPDQGARDLAQYVAQQVHKPYSVLEKKRPEHDQVTISHMIDDVKNKKILIVDDMISTGQTAVQAAHVLHDAGARDIRVAAMHGIFSGKALETLQSSPIKKVWVSNTLEQKEYDDFVHVVDISGLLETMMIHQRKN